MNHIAIIDRRIKLNLDTMRYSYASLIFMLVTSVATQKADGPVRIAVSKDVMNEYIFEGKELSILYTIYNFHPSRVAQNVELFDVYSDTQFIQIHGSPSARWTHIPASSNVSHAVVIVPRAPGMHNLTSATVTYHTGDPSRPTLHYSSAPGQVMVYPIKEYNRRYATYTMEWIGFTMLVTPCLLIPYLLWYSMAKKYLSN